MYKVSQCVSLDWSTCSSYIEYMVIWRAFENPELCIIPIVVYNYATLNGNTNDIYQVENNIN